MRLKKTAWVVTSITIILAMGTMAYLYRSSENKKNETAEIERQVNIKKRKEAIVVKAEKMKKGYFINEAIEELLSDEEVIDEEIKEKVDEYKKYQDSFVKYEGDIEHIFFHSLIIYPELAFDNKGHDSNGYNMWFNTNSEFKKILPQLKERGYILMNLTDIYAKNSNGEMVKNDIYLPSGKKPLIISQDDVNYYDYMEPDGFADKLVISEDNEVLTEVKNLNGEIEITRDGDIVPILDDFVRDNPDFSYRGAKGILAVTGYEGALGYKLETEDNVNKAIAVANKLKENGWLFASHSYTHNGKGFFGEAPVYSNLEYDFRRWKEKIEPVVGKTNIFISPFGVTLEKENFKLAKKFGFDIYCNVARISGDKVLENTIINPRFNIDGYSFKRATEVINDRFFNVKDVFDKSRPVLKE